VSIPGVVVAGEALFDVVSGPDLALAAHAGGGPFNVARTLGRLGVDVAFLGRLSEDRFGARHRAILREDGVRLDHVVDGGEPTTLAVAELAADGRASYRFYLEHTAAIGLRPPEALAAAPDGAGALVVGTLALAVAPAADAVEALVERLAGEALVVLDPNVRPPALLDEEAYRRRLERVLARTHVLKASDEDLEWILPGRPDEDAARELLGAGPAVVVVTRGPEGASVVTPEGTLRVPAPAVEVADTIGAGDAFLGGWLAHWTASGPPREGLGDRARLEAATRFACEIAAATCARPGADPPRRTGWRPA
jgi:fructokinase